MSEAAQPNSAPEKAAKESKRQQLWWPLNLGEDAELSNATSVTTVPGGYVIEFARIMVTGLINRQQPEIDEWFEGREVPVLVRVFMPREAAVGLRENLTKRFIADGVITPKAASGE